MVLSAYLWLHPVTSRRLIMMVCRGVPMFLVISRRSWIELMSGLSWLMLQRSVMVVIWSCVVMSLHQVIAIGLWWLVVFRRYMVIL